MRKHKRPGDASESAVRVEYSGGGNAPEGDDVEQYFYKRYEKAGFTVVPGHWPKFKTEAEVDEWFDLHERVLEAFRS